MRYNVTVSSYAGRLQTRVASSLLEAWLMADEYHRYRRDVHTVRPTGNPLRSVQRWPDGTKLTIRPVF